MCVVSLLAGLADHLQIAHANIPCLFCFLGLGTFIRLGRLARLTTLRFHCSCDRDLVADMLRQIHAFAAKAISLPAICDRVLACLIALLQTSRDCHRVTALGARLVSFLLAGHRALGGARECNRQCHHSSNFQDRVTLHGESSSTVGAQLYRVFISREGFLTSSRIDQLRSRFSKGIVLLYLLHFLLLVLEYRPLLGGLSFRGRA